MTATFVILRPDFREGAKAGQGGGELEKIVRGLKGRFD